MAKKPETVETVSELEALATRLDALALEADALDPVTAKGLRNSAKSARWADKQRTARLKRVGSIVTALQAQGLSPEEIVARLTGGQA